jgi:hypothetical protein
MKARTRFAGKENAAPFSEAAFRVWRIFLMPET